MLHIEQQPPTFSSTSQPELQTARAHATAAAASTSLALFSPRAGGIFLIAGGLLFWAAWLLMPGVGITDAQRIFELVGAHRFSVKLSVVLQLISAACYAPACIALALRAQAERERDLQIGALLLAMGALGSAADSVFHWLAAEMTAPGISQSAMLPVMARMQGPALVAVGPLIALFFIGSYVLLAAASSKWLPSGRRVLAFFAPSLLALPVSVLLGELRITGLLFLGCVAAAHAWVGVGLLGRTHASRVGRLPLGCLRLSDWRLCIDP